MNSYLTEGKHRGLPHGGSSLPKKGVRLPKSIKGHYLPGKKHKKPYRNPIKGDNNKDDPEETEVVMREDELTEYSDYDSSDYSDDEETPTKYLSGKDLMYSHQLNNSIVSQFNSPLRPRGKVLKQVDEIEHKSN